MNKYELKNALFRIAGSISDLMFPRSCGMCGNRLYGHEKQVCTVCLRGLPRTGYHLKKGNPVEMLFWGLMPIERATALMFYRGEKTRTAVHRLKYFDNPHIGEYLAEVMSDEIKDSGFFEGIDCIVPVPLSRRKKMSRGYNQSEWIAKGIRRITGIEIIDNAVRRVVDNKTQTQMKHSERWKNVENIFRLTRPELITGKHVLIVDDVVTTGSTIVSLGNELIKAGNVKLSVATLGTALQ